MFLAKIRRQEASAVMTNKRTIEQNQIDRTDPLGIDEKRDFTLEELGQKFP